MSNLYNYYICGSDQIWNIRPSDHSDAYFLPFAKGKKIAYAPSFGGMDSVDNDSKIKEYLMDFEALSVREESGRKIILDLLGKEVPVLPDPTLLLRKDDWDTITPKRIIEDDYILFYTLYATPKTISAVKQISKQLDLPVIITTITNQYDIVSGFVKKIETGPLEFLSLVKYAKYVCVCSFHGTVFSILMHKQFTVIDGMGDLRISTLLRRLNLANRSWDTQEPLDIQKCLETIDYDIVDVCIEDYRKDGLQYLKKALDL
ncbi:polysaccharide pyruvyl transferase family protein [Mediterraneibacter sp.]